MGHDTTCHGHDLGVPRSWFWRATVMILAWHTYYFETTQCVCNGIYFPLTSSPRLFAVIKHLPHTIGVWGSRTDTKENAVTSGNIPPPPTRPTMFWNYLWSRATWNTRSSAFGIRFLCHWPRHQVRYKSISQMAREVRHQLIKLAR